MESRQHKHLGAQVGPLEKLFQRKTKGQPLKCKIVSALFCTFRTFRTFRPFPHFSTLIQKFFPGLFFKFRLKKKKKKKKTKPFCKSVVARLFSSNFSQKSKTHFPLPEKDEPEGHTLAGTQGFCSQLKLSKGSPSILCAAYLEIMQDEEEPNSPTLLLSRLDRGSPCPHQGVFPIVLSVSLSSLSLSPSISLSHSLSINVCFLFLSLSLYISLFSLLSFFFSLFFFFFSLSLSLSLSISLLYHFYLFCLFYLFYLFHLFCFLFVLA